MTSSSSTREKRPRSESETSGDLAEGREESRPLPSFADSAMHTLENEEMVIATIRATNVALGLRRLPAGFYTVVHHNGLQWRTENKVSSVNDDVVEWSGPIPIPSDLSAPIRLEVFASFEFQPMLGGGEQLRELTTTVERLLDRSAKELPFTFFPKDGDVVSPCASILVAIKRRKYEDYNSSGSRVLGHHWSTTESQGEVEDATNEGRGALSRYQKHGEQWELERSIQQFERALNICPLGHPCRATTQSNLAMSKLIFCQVGDTETSLEAPLRLYRNALAARPVGHLDRPCTLIHLAAVHFAQIKKRRDHTREAQAEALLHQAMELSSTESHQKRAASFMLQAHARHRVRLLQPEGQPSARQASTSRLTDEVSGILSDWLLERFEEFDDLADLELAIAILEGLVRCTSIWDDRYRARLGDLGVALRYRFQLLGRLSDLEDAISRHRDAVDLAPDGHPDKPLHLNNLGNSVITRFKRLGQLSDLEDAISTLRDAVDLTPDGHPSKPGYLNSLGTSFKTRFQHLGHLSDLEDAISKQRDAVELTPDRHANKPRRLNNLGYSLQTRFQRLGQLSDLEDAISTLRRAVDLTPDGDLAKPTCLNNLGNSFIIRFQRLGQLSDLEAAISALRRAVDLTPHDCPDKPICLSNLANCFLTRFQHLEQLNDLEHAISTLRDAVDLTPDGDLAKPTCLNNLGNTFIARFQHLGQSSDLEDAILKLTAAVDLTPDGHPDKPHRLNNLGNSFFTRFQHVGQLTDLEDAVSKYKDAVDLTPDGHPNMPSHLSNLGNSFFTRFKHLGHLSDLEGAISSHRDAVDLTPDGHPEKPRHLNNLGNSSKTRFERLGQLSDLEDAISRHRDAVNLTLDGHPDKPTCLNNLGTSLKTRFECLGRLSDLEDTISTLRDAVNLTPDGHPDKARHLNSLGNSFFACFERLGHLSDLEDAISRHRDAVDLTPDGHLDKPTYLNNLGSSFKTRFERLRQPSDLEDAISRQRDAVDLTPNRHANKPGHLSNLGNSLFARFQRLEELSDLEGAISRHKDAVDLAPDGHLDKPAYLSNLGNSFKVRFQRLRQLSDIEDAISRHMDAVDLTADGHTDKPSRLNNLGNSFLTRFEGLGELSDLEGAISRHSDAVGLTPHSHPDMPGRLHDLGNSFGIRFQHLAQLSDLEQAISLYSRAASTPIGPIAARFSASQIWISYARIIRHHSLLHAYSVAISLLPQLAWIGLSLTDRYSALMQGADLVREAAAAALDAGFPETAVEWLEQGRSIVWGELFQLRSSHDDLSAAHPDHARRLQDLSAALESAGATHEKLLSTLTEQIQSAARPVAESSKRSNQEADRRRMLAIERDKLLQEIRRLPGFEQFLLRKRFSQLRASAHSGPVVILNAAETRCDALIVLAHVDHVIHVPLPNFTFQRSTGLQNMLEKLLGHARGIPSSDERKGNPSTWRGISWESLLSMLWNGVVKPVLDTLAFTTPGDLSRIFWCPTGPFVFLPIHAAGFYGLQHSQPGHKVSDFVVSSYAPSLSILALPPNPAAVPIGDLRLFAVRQPPSDGQSPLPGVATELEHIKEVVKCSPSAQTTLVESSEGTVEEVLSLMKEADWVHFACHGIQDDLDSGLCLADRRRLKLRDIVALSRPRGGLAFLSACQTATGEARLSDEAIHVAAGMLFAGYGGVIGTMWSISDKLAPRVARDVYGELFRGGARPDWRAAARALHGAVGRLRGRNASFVEWLPFVHVGL